jgi:hypothetical protein
MSPDYIAMHSALRAAEHCIAGALTLIDYSPEPTALLTLLEGVERYTAEARAALVASRGTVAGDTEGGEA